MKDKRNSDFRRPAGSALLAVAFFAITVSIGAADTRLYGEYVYGYPVSQLVNETGAFDCSDDVGSGHWICIDNKQFAGHDVSILFRIENDIVISITLLADFSEQAYADFFGAMISKFEIVLLSNGESTYDILRSSKLKNQATIAQEVAEFEREALLGGSIRYTFVEESNADSLKSFSNLTELIANVDSARRFTDLQIVGDGETLFLSVLFYMPGKQVNAIRESIEREFEDF